MTQHKLRRFGRSGLGYVPISLPVLLFVLLSVCAPAFLTIKNITDFNNQITALLIVSLGQLFVALIGGIDISIGSVVSLTSVVIVSLNPALAVPAAIVLGIVIGLANGLGVSFGVHPLIMTLATMTFLQGLSLLILAGAGGTVPAALIFAAKSHLFGIPAAFFWCIAVIAVAYVLLYRCRFGLRIFAIGGNAQSAKLSGVRAFWPQLSCYVLCSLAGVVAGIYLAGRIASGDPTMGDYFSLGSVTAIALGGVQFAGGVGSVAGAVLGAITLGLISNGLNMLGVSPFFSTALTGFLLLGAISLQRRQVIGV